jgi:ABC-type branched-subunit amino acid transport system substrate-binding protein
VTMGVANYMSSTGIPEIVLMQKGIAVLKFGGGNIFLPFGTHEGTGARLGLYCYDKLGYKTATALYEDFVAGQEFVGGTIAAFEKQGGKVIQKQAIKSGTMDFGPYLAAIQKADVVFFWFTPAQTQRFVAQYYAAGLKTPLALSLSSVLFSQTLATVGDPAIGIVGSGPYTSLLDTPMNKAYVEAMFKKYQRLPDAQVLSAEVALTMYLEALKATGGDTTPAKVNEALRKVKVNTPAGTFSFTPQGLGIGDAYIMQVIKTTDRYDWKVIDTYSQVEMDVPK